LDVVWSDRILGKRNKPQAEKDQISVLIYTKLEYLPIMPLFYIPRANTGSYTLKLTHPISTAPDLYPYDASEEVKEYLVAASKLTVNGEIVLWARNNNSFIHT